MVPSANRPSVSPPSPKCPQRNHTVYYLSKKRRRGRRHPFFSQLSEGIDTGCRQASYFLNITYLYEDDNLPNQLSKLLAPGCRGIIPLGTEMDEHAFAPFLTLPVPIVVLDTFFEGISANYVQIANVQGAFLAAGHLIRKYRTQPGYLRSSYPIGNFSERADGFYKAIRKNGMPASKSPVHTLSPSMEGAYEDMRELLRQGEAPARCYFADNDLIADKNASPVKIEIETSLVLRQS